MHAPGATNDVDMSFRELSEPVDMSSDGKMVIFTESGTAAGSNYQVCMRRTDGSPVVVLGEGGAVDLSDDNRWVLAGILPNRVIAYPTGAGQAVELKVLEVDPIHHRIVLAATGFPKDDVGAPPLQPAPVPVSDETPGETPTG